MTFSTLTGRMRYANFDIRIRKARAGYDVEVSSPAGEGHGRFRVPRELALRMGGHGASRRARHLEVDLPRRASKEIGQKLFDALFTEPVWALFLASERETQWKGQGLRIRLMLAQAPKLVLLPWEHLWDTRRDQPLAISPRISIVRYLEVSAPPVPPKHKAPLRVLVVSANPVDTCRLDLDRENKSLADGLFWLRRMRRVILDRLEKAKLSALVEQISRTRYDVLHFMGHGEFGDEGGILVFEDEQGKSAPVPFDQVAALLYDHGLRLVVLNACEGARSSGADPFDGVAQSLIRKGIPTVVAMQAPVGDESAIDFARIFYRTLAKGKPVEEAVTRARRAVFARERSSDWLAPVLYTRVDDGRVIYPFPWRWLAAVLVLAGIAALAVPKIRVVPACHPPRTSNSNPAECPSPPGLDMAFVRVPPDSKISKPFCFGVFEVTRGQYARVMGGPLLAAPEACLPQGGVTWKEARLFVDRLNRKEGKRLYRLPANEEWEHATRAGSTTDYYFGDDTSFLSQHGNCSIGDIDDGYDGPAPVGSFRPNPWGLYDVYGNVWEWVNSGAGDDAERQVRRGGGWDSGAKTCNSSHQSVVRADRQNIDTGLRIVREIQ